MSLLRTLQRATTSPGSACVWLLWAATLIPSTSFGQINDLDGVWQGTLACSEQVDPSGRPGSPPFTAPLPVTVSMGAMTARRETARIIEIHNGTIQRSGHASLDAIGRRKDASGKPWRLRLKGIQTGTSMALSGPLESVDGKEKWRTCKLALTLSTPPARAQAADATRAAPTRPATPAAVPPPVPVARPQPAPLPKAALPPTQPTEDRQAAARHQAEVEAAANAKALELAAARTAANQAAADRAAADRAAAEKLAADKAAAEKAAADKRAEDGKKAPIRVRSTMDL